MQRSSRIRLIARAAPSARVVPDPRHGAFIESDLSSNRTMQPGFPRANVWSYITAPCSWSSGWGAPSWVDLPDGPGLAWAPRPGAGARQALEVVAGRGGLDVQAEPAAV